MDVKRSMKEKTELKKKLREELEKLKLEIKEKDPSVKRVSDKMIKEEAQKKEAIEIRSILRQKGLI